MRVTNNSLLNPPSPLCLRASVPQFSPAKARQTLPNHTTQSKCAKRTHRATKTHTAPQFQRTACPEHVEAAQNKPTATPRPGDYSALPLPRPNCAKLPNEPNDLCQSATTPSTSPIACVV